MNVLQVYVSESGMVDSRDFCLAALLTRWQVVWHIASDESPVTYVILDEWFDGQG